MIGKDKIKHVLYCCIAALGIGLCIIGCLALGGIHTTAATWAIFVGSVLGGIACGIGKEYADYVYATWDWADVAADAVGSIIGASLASLINLVI